MVCQGVAERQFCSSVPLQPARLTHTRAPRPNTQLHQSRTRRMQHLDVRADSSRNGGGGFLTGFVVGGTIFGALGFLFAPQISAALLSEDQRLKLPKFLDDEARDPETTKQDLADKIAQLNSAIDDVSAQLNSKDVLPVKEEATA